MTTDSDFQDRLFLGGQAVYERIVTGQCQDAEAELMAVQLTESTREDD